LNSLGHFCSADNLANPTNLRNMGNLKVGFDNFNNNYIHIHNL
jgi:hypothetical protein